MSQLSASKKWGIVLLGMLSLALLFFVALQLRPDSLKPAAHKPSVPTKSPGQEAPESTTSNQEIVSTKEVTPPPYLTAKTSDSLKALLEKTLQRLKTSQTSEQTLAILDELRQAMANGIDAEVAATVLEFLQGGQDASTNLPFLVGQDGALQSAPTLRTFLMDLLPQYDPIASLQIAREVMETRTNPDEYAMSLRNLAWNDFEGDTRSELSARFKDMLDMNDWLKQPSTGFLEAFDIGVQLADMNAFREIASVVRLEDVSGNPLKNGTDRSAFMALDRIALRNPDLLGTLMNEDPDFLGYSPNNRASLMSRLDITQESQRETLLKYLTHEATTPSELEYFAEIFPNGNYLQGPRLVTTDEPALNISERRMADQATFNVLQELIPTLPEGPPKASATRIQERLQYFINQTGADLPPQAKPAIQDPSER
jgi:hypothetical protein